MADALFQEDEEERVTVSKSGRVFRSFDPPAKHLAALEAAQRHIQRSTAPIAIRQKAGYIDFERIAQNDLEKFTESIHPQAAFYPSLHKASRSKKEMLQMLGANLENGLGKQQVKKEQHHEVEAMEDDVLDGLDGVGTTGLSMSFASQVHRVIRDKQEHTFEARLLVKGDVIRLMPGDVVPTDMYVAQVTTRPCVIVRRCVQDYCDYVSTQQALDIHDKSSRKDQKEQRISSAARQNDAFGRSTSSASQTSAFSRSASAEEARTQADNKFIQQRAEMKAERKNQKTDGWTAGVRVCLPVCSEGSIISHGDVVQWGECLAVCICEARESTWASAWRSCLRCRAIRAEELLEKQAEEKRKRDRIASEMLGKKKLSIFPSFRGSAQKKKSQDVVVSPELAKQMKSLSRLGVFVDHAPVASILMDITCIVIEDDIRFKDISGDQDLGIGVGVDIDEDELHFRYDDLLNMAQRAGIAVMIMLRTSGTTALEASRLARWLRFVNCSDSVNRFDLQTPSLYALFEHGGAVCRVDSKVSSASELVDNLQRCNARVMNPTYHRQVVQSLRNPHGVLSHIVQTGTYQPPQISQDSLTQRGGSAEEDDQVEEARNKKLMSNLIQDDEDLPRRHLVAYVGEDWGGLAASDVPITWSQTMSPGGFESRKLAAIRLRENSPARMMQALTEFEMKRYETMGGIKSNCAVA